MTLGNVVVVAPDSAQSGKSSAISVNTPLFINEHQPLEGARMMSANGTPVDCVKLAMFAVLDRRPDLILSGINHGSNSAVNVLYSGTMGAAMEGCAFGIPSIGFSLTDHSHDADFTPCYKAIDLLVKEVLEHGLPEDICLNVNVPNIGSTPEEMRLAVACRGRWNDEYREYTDPYLSLIHI